MHSQDSFTQDEQASLNDDKNKRWKSYLKYLPRLIGVIIFVIAIYVVQDQFKQLSLKDIKETLKSIPSVALYAAGGCTFLSFLVLSFYDKLAVIQVGYKLSFLKTAFAAFCSYVLSHNIGFSAVSGAIVRFRLYGSWGLNTLAIVQVIAFCSVTYVLGAGVLIGGLFLFEASNLPLIGGKLPSFVFMIIGAVCWLLVGLYIIISFYCNELKIWKYRFTFPNPLMAVAQIVVATIEVIVTAAIPYCVIPNHGLLPGYQAIDFPTFLGIYIASYTAGLVASVPGGAGVFEGSMLLALAPYMPAKVIVSVILIFRVFYYLVPLLFAGTMFASHEIFLRGGSALRNNAKRLFLVTLRPTSTNENLRESDAAFSVNIAAAVIGICGLTALALPVLDPTTWNSLQSWFLFFEVAGDYVLSFLGVLLLTLTVALARRITTAWRLSLIALTILTIISVIKGVPLYISALFVLAIFFIAPFRSCYYRKAHFSATPFSFKTVIEIFILIITVYVIVWISPQHTSNHGLIELLLSRHVSFEIKLIIAMMAVIGVGILFKMMIPAKIQCEVWSDKTESLYNFIANSKIQCVTAVEPTGILICSNEGTIIPFLRKSNFLVGFGDPVGKDEEIINTIWRVRDLSVQEGRSVAFWNVSSKYLSVYQDLGLATIPLSEDGRYVCCELKYTTYLYNIIQHKIKTRA